FKSASPLVTLGKKIDGAFSPCELTDTKMKVNTTAKLTDDISELLKEPLKVSLADTELSGNAMGGTAVKLNSSAKKISYKGTEGNVKLSVKINIAKKKVAVKYTGKDTVMPALCREPKTE
ncbi:hypothetical protein IKZ80_07700, partial [bacterium]|nr:hypothetical protein [bacterium]